MISVFQVFKIIMGLLIAGFFFYIILTFSGIYSWFQTGQQNRIIMQNFRDTVHNVYVNDVPVAFDFLTLDGVRYDRPPYITAVEGEVRVAVPLLFKPGSRIYVYRQTLDMGWWKFHWVGALPAMKVIFNPLCYSDNCWDSMRSMAEVFPQTEDPEITLGFCSGEKEYEGVTRDYFISAIREPKDLNFTLCTKSFPDNYFVITIAENVTGSGFPVRPLGQGVGIVQYAGENFTYSDPLDLLALYLGHGNTWGYGSVYRYKNSLLFSELQLAAKKEAERCELMRLQRKCIDTYGELRDILCTNDPDTICMLAASIMESSYSRPDDFLRLAELNEQAASKYRALEVEGCE